MNALLTRLEALTDAIEALAQSNRDLIMTMIEMDQEQEAPATEYLDGTSCL